MKIPKAFNYIFKSLNANSEFARNAFKLTIGTTIAQLFPIIFYPILGRIFTPDEFGLLAVLGTITAILTIIATGKYEMSIIVADSKNEAANIVGLVLLLSSIILLISFFLILCFSGTISFWFNEPELSKWLFISPITAFVIIIYNSYNEWCVLNKYFNFLSWNKITNAAATTLSKLFFGFVNIIGNGLIFGDLLGRSMSAGACVFRALKNDKQVFSQITFKNSIKAGQKYIDFPKFIMPDQLLSSLGQSLPVILIGIYATNMEVGYYSMTLMVLTVPLSVIGAAIRDVFRQRANEDFKNKGNCKGIYKNLLKKISILSITVSLAIVWILPAIFSFVLGEQWLVAGIYSQILLPMIVLSFISMSLSGVLIITGKMKVSMYWQMFYLVTTFLGLIIGFIVFDSVEAALIGLTIARSFSYVVYIHLSFKYSKGDNKTGIIRPLK